MLGKKQISLAIALCALSQQAAAQFGGSGSPCPSGMTLSVNSANLPKCVGVMILDAPSGSISPSRSTSSAPAQPAARAATQAANAAPAWAVGAPGVAPPPEYVPLKRGMPAAYYIPEMTPNGQPAAFSRAEFDQREELTRRSVATWHPGRPSLSGTFEVAVARADGTVWTEGGELLAGTVGGPPAAPAAPVYQASAPSGPAWAVGAPGVAPPPEYVPLKRGMPASYYIPEMTPNGQRAAYSQAEFDQREELTRRSVATWLPGRPALSGAFEVPVVKQDGSVWTPGGELLAAPN